MLRSSLFLTALLLVRGGDAICTAYQSSCNLLTGVTCCGFPLNLCLPDNNNGSSCLSPFDLVNVSPSFTSLVPFASVGRSLENAGNSVLGVALNPVVDPLANPILDPVANPILDPLANPILDPVANPSFNPLVRNA